MCGVQGVGSRERHCLHPSSWFGRGHTASVTCHSRYRTPLRCDCRSWVNPDHLRMKAAQRHKERNWGASQC